MIDPMPANASSASCGRLTDMLLAFASLSETKIISIGSPLLVRSPYHKRPRVPLRLLHLQNLYFRSAPRELATSSRVKSYSAGTLIVFAESSAVASKLKQLAP